jgi:outer membrane lipoprotein-sorting protein
MKGFAFRSFALALAATGVWALPSAGQTAEEVLARRRELEAGAYRWTDRHQTMKMRLLGGGRDERRVLEIDSYDKRFGDGRSATVVFISAPSDVEGTAFLGERRAGQPSQQWLYLPWAKKTRRITRPASESFMGSDLTYGDVDLLRELPSWSGNDAEASLLPREAVDGVASHVLVLVPKRKDIEYARVVVWLGTADLIARRIDLHADGKDARKRILQKDVRAAGSVPVPRTIEVETLATRTRTEIAVTDVVFDQGLDDALFTQPALPRGGR